MSKMGGVTSVQPVSISCRIFCKNQHPRCWGRGSPSRLIRDGRKVNVLQWWPHKMLGTNDWVTMFPCEKSFKFNRSHWCSQCAFILFIILPGIFRIFRFKYQISTEFIQIKYMKYEVTWNHSNLSLIYFELNKDLNVICFGLCLFDCHSMRK